MMAIEKTIDGPKNDKKHDDSKDGNNNFFFLLIRKSPFQQTFLTSRINGEYLRKEKLRGLYPSQPFFMNQLVRLIS